jgi:hypothetical protein
MKKSTWIFGALILLLVACPVVTLRMRTVRAISKIESLQGRSGEFAELMKLMDTHYNRIETAEGLEHARIKLGITTITNLVLVRCNGEGLPYYYGYVAFDTNTHTVVRTVVNQLW